MTSIKAHIINWLGIAKALDYVDSQKKEIDKQVSNINRDADYWHRQFKKFSFTQCGHCKQKLMVWPYESVAYYHKDDKYIHSACYDAYLTVAGEKE